MSDCISP